MKGIGGLRQQGMSLIEVLVALLVLGIGVMGYAALQLNAVKITEDTYSRSQAMAIAQDLAERIRVNIGEYGRYLADASWSGSVGDKPGEDCITVGATLPAACTSAQMAAIDIYDVRSTAQSLLLNGAVVVAACPATVPLTNGDGSPQLDVDGNPLTQVVSSGVSCITVAWNETTPADCDQTQVTNDDIGTDASCVVLEFIP